MGIGDWAQSPIPNPQSPIPNPQSPIPNMIKEECTEDIKQFFIIIVYQLIVNIY